MPGSSSNIFKLLAVNDEVVFWIGFSVLSVEVISVCGLCFIIIFILFVVQSFVLSIFCNSIYSFLAKFKRIAAYSSLICLLDFSLQKTNDDANTGSKSLGISLK